MLNELRDLAKSLDRAGIARSDWHKYFKPLPKTSSFWLFINDNGKLTDIEEVPPDQIATIRKWEKSNGESFPAFNIPALFKPPESVEMKENIKEIRKKVEEQRLVDTDIEKVLDSSKNNWTTIKKKKREIDRIKNYLDRVLIEVESQFENVPPEYSSITELCDRAKKMEVCSFHDQMKRLVLKKLFRTQDSRYIDILWGTKKFQIIIELSDWAQQNYQYPANHQEVQKWMNQMFLEHEHKTIKEDTSSNDAFGESASGKDQKKYPEVTLPVLGKVKLRSMVKEIPAQTRYGMIEAGSFPAGDKVRKEMKSALEWLSKPEHKGKAWCDLTKKTDKASLLFAYLAEMPESPPELAGLLGGTDDKSEDPEGALFSAIAGRVTSTLKGIAASRPDTEVRIFVLAKMDKARTKVIASKRYTAEHMIDSADRWQEGCKNIPAIKIRQFGKEKGETQWAEALVPFPAEVVWCLNTAWLRQGTYPKAVHGYSINEALSLLLNTGHEIRHIANRAIYTIVRNSSPLIVAVGQENHFARVFRVTQAYSKQPRLLPTILGLLLYKLGNMKGGYMSSPAFLVGRFMSLADKLHLKYCEHVRKGSIPPQLVGNALMATALEEPGKALSMISQRILPYQAWANTMKEGEDVGLIKYFLGQLGEVSEKLKDLDIPSRCSDEDKAQMLLGYLAWSEKTKD